jgi:hypothetical protein
MKLLLSALVGISVIESGTGNNMLEGFEYAGLCKVLMEGLVFHAIDTHQ